MLDIFTHKEAWISFAESHNAAAVSNATPLNGSQSYTLAAIHLAGGIPIPKSVLLDTRRARGKFIADHFSGLRELYESGIESGPWLPGILKRCREIAAVNGLDSDDVVRDLIELTEKRPQERRRSHRSPLRAKKTEAVLSTAKTSPLNLCDPDDLKI